jgi:transcriptional regulator with XRE-family HTH domain
METKILVADLIKCWRERQNMSQTELADRLGVDKQYVWRIENGDVNMTCNYLDKVIRCLGCSHQEFWATMHLNTAINA